MNMHIDELLVNNIGSLIVQNMRLLQDIIQKAFLKH